MFSFWSIFKESFILSLQQLWNNKLRSGLSLLGVTIGIFSIIAILTAIDALKNDISGSINKLGDNIVFVGKWPWTFSDSDYPWWKYWTRPEIGYDDYRKIKARLTKAKAVSFSVEPSISDISYRGEAVDNVSVVGATVDYQDVFELDIEEGRFYSEAEANLGTAVAVIGGGIAEELGQFGSYLIGRDIMILGRKVKIIGILRKEGQGGLLGTNNDKQIYVPYIFMNNISYINPRQSSPEIQVKAIDGISLDELMFDIQQHMRSVRKLRPKQQDDFAMNQLSLITQSFEGIFYLLSWIGWVIGFFALIVGGFGIANIMYVSVTERTSIIGVKKALGAKSIYILIEFLIEAILLCVIGGALGLLMIATIVEPLSEVSGMTFVLSWDNAVIGLSISIIIGLVSGYLPAKKAAGLNPVDAIRTSI